MGLLALIVVAGVSCQPFSEAGQMKFDKDSRAWDAFLVIDAAVALQAAWVILENVPNYVDRDSQHGVFTKLKAHALERGFSLVRVLYPRHDRCGGETYRQRVIIIFLRSELIKTTDLSILLAVTHDEGTIAEPTNYKLDKSRDWALYGELLERRGGTWLKFTTRIPVEGAVVRIDDSARSWRVQKRRRDSVDLIVTDRRASHRRNAVDIGKVQVLSTEDSEYKVFSPGDVVTTIRAFGEPPGCGAPLILSEGGVWSCAVGDRASLNAFTGAELAGMRQAALTDDEIVSMIGNCAPRKLETWTTMKQMQMEGQTRQPSREEAVLARCKP